jgi:hypothetical protein
LSSLRSGPNISSSLPTTEEIAANKHREATPAVEKPHPTKKKRSLFEAIEHWRATTDLSDLGDIDEIWADVRDESPGRDIDL